MARKQPPLLNGLTFLLTRQACGETKQVSRSFPTINNGHFRLPFPQKKSPLPLENIPDIPDAAKSGLPGYACHAFLENACLTRWLFKHRSRFYALAAFHKDIISPSAASPTLTCPSVVYVQAPAEATERPAQHGADPQAYAGRQAESPRVDGGKRGAAKRVSFAQVRRMGGGRI